MAKLITVFGATGNQGGSLVRALLQEKDIFKVRGVTRNVESERAKALANQGVEMVKASTDDADSLEKAMAGSYGVFAMTNYWELMDQEKEVQMGKNMVDAAKNAGVEHFIFSGLQPIGKLTGKACPHFDGKAEIEEYMFDSGVPATSVRYAAFMENILTQSIPQKTGDGQYVWNIPMENKEFDMVYTGRAGPAVAAIFKDRAQYTGKSIGLSGDRKTVPQFCEILSRYIAPATVTASQMTAEVFSKLPFPGADDLGVMFQFLQTSDPCYSVEETKKLDPNTMNFEDFVKENKEKIMAVMK